MPTGLSLFPPDFLNNFIFEYLIEYIYKHNRGEKFIVSSLKESIIKETREADGIIYTYTLMLHEDIKLSTIGIPLYSISVEMTVLANGVTTSATTKELFADEDKARAFFDKLVRNLATPIDLAYILEDEF